MKKSSRPPFKDRPIHIGVDFDNTIISYDDLFHRCALERSLIPEGLPKRKSAVRAYLWNLPDGNNLWTALQGEVYGSRINEAEPYPGALKFFSLCRERKVHVTIVSHKAEFPALGPRVNLRDAAREWIGAHGIFPESAMSGSLFFEADRKAKVERIAHLKCTHFIDDLPEVFTDTLFPAGTEKILFAIEPSAAGDHPEEVKVFSNWPSITAFFGLI